MDRNGCIEAWGMKIDRHGQAKILTTEEIQLLFNEGVKLDPPRDQALFAVMLYGVMLEKLSAHSVKKKTRD
ncbi:hypothetical protein [Moorena sp. SIO3B2]|uniref:hypothetical protein n=1 Tax=Moorena sp. SIO3B2 TaxID=2607827 RepID=UPI00257CDF03|nr:hypothetical protein [Moorena sp. SIO3B2]